MLLNAVQPPLALLRHTDVPPRVTESFILSGYRFPNYSLRQCLMSAFRPTNETGNFWTHFLSVFVFFYYLVEVFGWDGAPPASAPFFYPLWNYVVGVLCLLVASSMAHLLNSMSLLVREVCFFVDYGTISSYTVGSSLAYFYYIHPRGPPAGGAAAAAGQNRSQVGMSRSCNGVPTSPEFTSPEFTSPEFTSPEFTSPEFTSPEFTSLFFESFYIPCACAVAIICVLSCCNTRQRWRRHRYVIRTLVFLLPFLVSSTPIFYRLLSASPYPRASPSFAASSESPAFFYRHSVWLLVSAAFNISKVPERLAPGRFDIWGHSHQWFHCCTFLSILDELHMIKAELRAVVLATAVPSPGPSVASTYGVMLLLQTTIVSIVGWFSWQANCTHRALREQQLDRKHPKGQ